MPIGPRPVDPSAYDKRVAAKRTRRPGDPTPANELAADAVEVHAAAIPEHEQVETRERSAGERDRRPPPPAQPSAKRAGLSIPLGGERIDVNRPKRLATKGFQPPVTGEFRFVRNATSGSYGAGRGSTPIANERRAAAAAANVSPQARAALQTRLAQERFGNLPGLGGGRSRPPAPAVGPAPASVAVPARVFTPRATPAAAALRTPAVAGPAPSQIDLAQRWSASPARSVGSTFGARLVPQHAEGAAPAARPKMSFPGAGPRLVQPAAGPVAAQPRET